MVDRECCGTGGEAMGVKLTGTAWTRRKIVACIPILYALGLLWGYVRLPLAALKSLRDGRLLFDAPAVSFGPDFDVSPAQRWYLKTAFVESPVPVVPEVSV